MNEKHVDFLSLIRTLKTMVDVLESNCDHENLIDVPFHKVNNDINSIKYVLKLIDSKKHELANEHILALDNEVQRQIKRDFRTINEVHEKVIE